MTTLSLPSVSAPSVAVPPPADDGLYEIIDGVRKELPPMSAYASLVASRLVAELAVWLKANDLGVVACEVLFELAVSGSRNRRPDLAFVSYKRWPKDRPVPEADNAWAVVPDLAVEVVSPNDLAEDLLEKVEELFEAGIELVWVVYPRRRAVQVFESPTRIRGLKNPEELDGGGVLPGFRLALTQLFQPAPTL
jgi:Uma2 family endonuclease